MFDFFYNFPPVRVTVLSGCVWGILLGPAALSAKAELNTKYTGAASCQSSGCHGGAGDLSRQYTIWSRADPHSRSYHTLTTARSRRIAEGLGAAESPTGARCTSCHAPMSGEVAAVKAGVKSPTLEEGVSCESCHGPASSWIQSHTRRDYSHGQRVSAGLRDLENLYLRANTCVACHVQIDPQIIQAGHPRLDFELEKLVRNQPRHWKEKWEGPQTWLAGQAAAYRELSGHLARSPGEPGLKLRWEQTGRLLARSLPGLDPELDRGSLFLRGPDTVDPLDKNLVPGADLLARRIAALPWTPDKTRTLLANLLDQAPSVVPSGGAAADSWGLAVGYCLERLPDEGLRRLQPEVRAMQKALEQNAPQAVIPSARSLREKM